MWKIYFPYRQWANKQEDITMSNTTGKHTPFSNEWTRRIEQLERENRELREWKEKMISIMTKFIEGGERHESTI